MVFLVDNHEFNKNFAFHLTHELLGIGTYIIQKIIFSDHNFITIYLPSYFDPSVEI